MVHRYTTFVKAINLTIDYLLLNVCMVLAYYIVDSSHLIWSSNHYIPVVLVFNLVWLLSTNITGLYTNVLIRDSVKTYNSLIKTYLLFISFIGFTIVIVVGTKAYFITREFLVYALLLFGSLLILWKLIFLAIRKSERAALFETRTFLVIGKGLLSQELYNYLKKNPQSGYKLIGIFDDEPHHLNINGLYKGKISDCINYAVRNKIDEIFCALPNSDSERIKKIMLEADRNLVRFKFVPTYFDFDDRPTLIETFGDIPIVSFRPEPLENMLNRFLKRVFDTLFSLFVILFVFSWLFPILAVFIKLTSKGPIFFVQVRSGRDNRPFKCYKFRTMRLSNKSDDKQVIKNDDRVTKIGAIMRRTSLDELPQFFNVLMGNMSVVGPRPHMISHTKQYARLIDTFMVRHFLKPGITGYAQVNGLRGEIKTTESMMQRVKADVWYLENWSFLLDMKIIFLTLWNVFRGDENAY